MNFPKEKTFTCNKFYQRFSLPVTCHPDNETMCKQSTEKRTENSNVLNLQNSISFRYRIQSDILEIIRSGYHFYFGDVILCFEKEMKELEI